MAIVKEPKPRPSELDFVPTGSTSYRVTNGDSWYSLAERGEVKAAGMSANDLCYFNFKTRKPTEINWYLYHKVGCRTSTRDGKNYMFSGADQPGIVYLPRIGPPPPVNEVPPNRTENRSNAWFGLCGKIGTQVVVVGIDTVAGYVASLDDLGKGMAVAGTIHRLGPGVGVSGGLSFIYITGVRGPDQLNGHLQGDWDFNLSLGGNWGKFAGAAAKAKKLKPLINVVNKIGARTPGGLKKALTADPDDWVNLIKAGKSVNEALGIDPNGEPNVFILDIPPAGGGVEASIFYGVSKFDAVWDFTE